ncbi:MAG: hypothetical protein RLY16_2231 [Bacteroidota bacterium]|jgi:prolipoprotein diacylglyceryltransferase
MYANLYYVIKDWFGLELKPMMFLNTFGLMVAISFVISAAVIALELKRKEKLGLLFPREEWILVGEPASWGDLLMNFITGFLFGYKMLGLFFAKPEEVSPQDYIFSSSGSWLGGLLLGGLLAGMKWREKKKQQLPVPEKRSVRIWPHDRVGDIVIISLIAGILGAKLFDNFENWDDFIQHPMERIFSAGGLTFYGGLIVATIAVIWFAIKKNIPVIHLADSIAPAMMLAYALGRIGCQVSGDGDWGIYNSAYITSANGKIELATPASFQANLNANSTYFLEGKVYDSSLRKLMPVTDRKSETLEKVPHLSIQAPKWLPVWLFAYNYPQNVNKDGVPIPGITDEHNRVLPSPVFPTPLYETLICGFFFLVLWAIRKKIKVAGLMSGIYLFLNGFERFAVEKIRVNNVTSFFGIHLSQAEIISFCLMLAGIGLSTWALMRKAKKQKKI